LDNVPKFVNAGIKISAADSMLFRKLNTQLSDIMAAVKAFGARKKRGARSGKGKGKAKPQDDKTDDEDSEWNNGLMLLITCVRALEQKKKGLIL
jgi:hypothetical protein